MCRLCRKFTSYLRRVLCKTCLTFPRINGPLVIIDAFLCPWGESPYIFSNLNLLADTPVNPDNRHLFLAPINLTNANTSLSTFFCNRSCLSECKIILEFTTFQCSQCYNTPDRMICSCQFETIYFGILQVM